jgi:hypothetical protein
MRRNRNSCHPSHKRAFWIVLSVAVLPLFFHSSSQAAGPTLEWIRQFGTPERDVVGGMSLDGFGHIYVTGETEGRLFATHAGYTDAFSSKFDVSGNQLWGRQVGSSGGDSYRSVAADPLGNVFITGSYNDGVFVGNYDVLGNVRWSRPMPGTISADGLGNVYVASHSGGDVVTKFDASGNELASMPFALSAVSANVRGSAADALGNTFVFGDYFASQGANLRAFLIRLDSDGNQVWTRQIASGRYVWAGGLAADGLGNVYISGRSNYTLTDSREYEGYDGFLAKYNAQGNRLWIREFGTPGFEEQAFGVAVDGLGSVYVVGNAGGSLGGPNLGGYDGFVAKFDVDGNQHWIHQFGTTSVDEVRYVSTDGLGNIYVAGTTSGDLGGTILGGWDGFLVKFRDQSAVPEPASLLLGTIAAFAFGRRYRKSVQREAVSVPAPSCATSKGI